MSAIRLTPFLLTLAAACAPPASLVRLAAAPAADCPAGGTAILSGRDDDGDGTLDDDEVDERAVVCAGDAGRDGVDGEDGRDGVDGDDGATTLIRLDDLVDDAACPAGGVLVRVGIDVDGDGLLDDDEVQSSRPICDGSAGADGANGSAGLIHALDVSTTTSTNGDAVLTFPTAFPAAPPELVYAEATLEEETTVTGSSGSPLVLPVGTRLKTVSTTATTLRLTARLVGPDNETLTNAAVRVFALAVEFAAAD